MKIGMFTDGYKPAVSGVVVSVAVLKQGLEALGHEVVVVTTKPVKIKNELQEEGVVRFSGFRIPKKGLDIYRLSTRLRSKAKKLANYDFDIIHVHTEFTMGKLGRTVAKKYNIPMVYTFHTMYEDYFHFVSRILAKAARKPMLDALKRMIRNYCDASKAIILPTEKVLVAFERYGFGEYPFHIIPTGIDVERFYKENINMDDVKSIKEKLGIKDEFVFLYLGRVSAEKSIEVLIKQFARIKDVGKAKLLIVGGGAHEKALKDLVGKLDLSEQVIFTGMIEPDLVPLYYQIGEVFLNASKTETQGLTYAEALASGLPVIVNDDLAVKEYIFHNENGLLTKNDDEFGDYMRELLLNDEVRINMAKKAQGSVKDLSKARYSERVLEVYNEVLKMD